MHRGTILFITLIVMIFAHRVLADEKVVQLTSLEWPPYTSETNPNGASEEVVRRAFKSMGYDVIVTYLPWNRAVRTVQNKSEYVGYFPEYFSEEQEKAFIFSAPMGTGPIGLAERKAQPLAWNKAEDLAGLTLGNVSGYVIPSMLAGQIASGTLFIDEAQTDALNLKKVAAGRIHAAIIDHNVMSHLLRTDPSLAGLADKLQFNPRVIDTMPLYLCFRKDAAGRKMADIFNEGLKNINVDEIMRAQFMKMNGSQ